MEKVIKSLVLLLALASLKAPAASPGQTEPTNSPAARKVTNLSDLFADTVVAKGKGLEIKRRQFDDEVIRAKAAYAASGMAAPPNLDQQVLDNLIGAKLVLGKATDADRAKGKEEFEKFIQKRKTDAKLTDEEFNQQVGRQLRLQRQTREEWEKQSTDQATIRAALERELKVNISDEEVKKFYDDNPSKFEQPEMVH